MKTVSIKQIEGTEFDVLFTGGNSQRLLTAKDGLGFSFSKTIIPKSETAHHWHYPFHKEACYCLSGKGILTNLKDGQEYIIEPETIYVLDDNDNHTFLPLTDVVLVSVFNPPLTGFEAHDETGCYRDETMLLKHKNKRELAKHIIKIVNNSESDYDAIDDLLSIIQ